MLKPPVTQFGTVIDGREHVDAIAEVPTGQNDKPNNDVTIVSVTIQMMESRTALSGTILVIKPAKGMLI